MVFPHKGLGRVPSLLIIMGRGNHFFNKTATFIVVKKNFFSETSYGFNHPFYACHILLYLFILHDVLNKRHMLSKCCYINAYMVTTQYQHKLREIKLIGGFLPLLIHEARRFFLQVALLHFFKIL